MLSLMAKERELFINIWESILARNKLVPSILYCYSPPFCGIQVELDAHLAARKENL